MRVQPREAHRRRGLAQLPSLGRVKDEEELRARVHCALFSFCSFTFSGIPALFAGLLPGFQFAIRNE